MISPKVSIIIPVYNHHAELQDCLVSIKKQTFQDFEVIVVNDGSTDTTPEILCQDVKFCLPERPVKCFSQPNQGAPAARNNGFRESSGQYVIFCDADIYMHSTMLAKMVKVLDENPDVSYVYSSFKFGLKKFRLWQFNEDKLKEMPYIHATSLMRREHLPGWDESLKRLQDWDLWLTMMEQGHVGRLIKRTLFYIKPSGSMSSWLPSFLMRLGLGQKARQYQAAVRIIKDKHHLY